MERVRRDTAVDPAMIGVGFRSPHLAAFQDARPALGWIEVHAENYMENGPSLERLLNLRRNYAVSLHGVGLSLGSAKGLDRKHLTRFAQLVKTTEPFLVSDHLSWSIVDGTYLNDLLPLPYTAEALEVVSRNVTVAQDALRRPLLVENPSRYLRFRHSTMTEPEFLSELVRRTGCQLLCDVNNIYVSAMNLDEDPQAYLTALPQTSVAEIHLAGHSRDASRGLLVDDHGGPVCEAVWALYRRALGLFGAVPSLVEWDTNIPAFPVLLREAHRTLTEAQEVLDARALAS